MSTETGTQQGGGAAAPASDTSTTSTAAAPAAKAPRSDAEAAQQERDAAQAAAAKPAATAATPEGEGNGEPGDKPNTDAEGEARKKNRTREYIERINRENAELRRQIAQQQAGRTPAGHQGGQGQQPADADPKPTLEDADFDEAKHREQLAQWAARQELKADRERQQKEQHETREREQWQTYDTKVAAFAEKHPDFTEVVGSIPYPLAVEAQLAIRDHERGPEIAYYLGNNDDEAFALASIRPDLAAAAVERLAKRLGAALAPRAPAAESGAAPAAQQAPAASAPAPRPITQAPPPAPRVGGRAPTDVPPEKLTDDEWYRADLERRRKR